jgi:hypothetical protein
VRTQGGLGYRVFRDLREGAGIVVGHFSKTDLLK